MNNIKFSADNKIHIVNKLQQYLQNELDCDAGQFDIEFLLDFISEEIGPHFYNQGLFDAQAILAEKVFTINEAISEIEKEV